MSKQVKDKSEDSKQPQDFELLERLYDIKGDGIAELRLEKAIESDDFRESVLEIFDAAKKEVEVNNNSTLDNKVS